jgi:hypothetical protein
MSSYADIPQLSNNAGWEKVTCLPLSALNQLSATSRGSGSSADGCESWMLAFSDPSSVSGHPSWVLRNLLLLIAVRHPAVKILKVSQPFFLAGQLSYKCLGLYFDELSQKIFKCSSNHMIHGCNEHFYSKHSTQQRLSSDLEHWQC